MHGFISSFTSFFSSNVMKTETQTAADSYHRSVKITNLLSRCSRQRERLSASVLSICSSVCLFVCLSPKCKKTRFSQKLSNLELRCLLTTYRRLCNWAFPRTHYWIPTIHSHFQDGRDPHLENRHDVIFFCRGWSDLDKILQTSTEWHVDCGDVWKSKPDLEFQYGGRMGEFNGMSYQSHVSYCRVLQLGEFTVTIPVPHATLQGAVTWRNQCHDRATLQGVRIPSAILKIVLRHILFIFFLF